MARISDAARLRDRLDALESRLHRLERSSGRATGRAGADRYWVLEGLRARLGKRGLGRVAYAGVVPTPAGARYQWQGEHAVDELLAMDWGDLARAFAALGHPVRLDIVQALLRGVSEVSELQRQPRLGTSGQLYHHLRELQAAGWVRQQERSRYWMVPDRVVCLLLVIGIVAGPAPRPERAPARTKRRRG